MFLFVFIFAMNAFGQDADYIKTLDTVYIVLKENEPMASQKFSNFTLHSSGNGSINEYIFELTPILKVYITTQHDDKYASKYNFEAKRRKFLKANKDKMIYLPFIDKLGVSEFFINTLALNKSKKKIFIINESDLKKRKIIIKKAFVYASGFDEM